jgi:hypothetical protein
MREFIRERADALFDFSTRLWTSLPGVISISYDTVFGYGFLPPVVSTASDILLSR